MSRYFVRFMEEAERSMVMSTLAPTAPESDRPYPARRDNHLLIADLGPEEVASARESGAEISPPAEFVRSWRVRVSSVTPSPTMA
jgi:hypothetical protein